jgi:hypothetical protein
MLILKKMNPSKMCKKLNISKDNIAPFYNKKNSQVIEERTQKIIEQKLNIKARG